MRRSKRARDLDWRERMQGGLLDCARFQGYSAPEWSPALKATCPPPARPQHSVRRSLRWLAFVLARHAKTELLEPLACRSYCLRPRTGEPRERLRHVYRPPLIDRALHCAKRDDRRSLNLASIARGQSCHRML